MEIIGVDFSGARSDSSTWMTRGRLRGDNLTLHACHPIKRSELAEVLGAVKAPAIAALDFPFSVPQAFARYWRPGASRMDDLWSAAAEMDLSEFTALRDEFVGSLGEPKRLCETHYPKSFSCLHKTNPNMVPMTFHGMRMLAGLWEAGCEVPPLKAERSEGAVLLEVMPGATLRCLGLPFTGYKGGSRTGELRQQILHGMERSSKLTLCNLDEFRDLCLAVHDCLDSVVAALTASLWHLDRSAFRLPDDSGPGGVTAQVQLEGWLYAPAFLR